MSFQVGAFCYATPVDAGAATCAAFSPASIVTSGGDSVVSTSCSGVNADTGALQLQIATTSVGGATTYQTVEQIPAYYPCQQAAFFDFWLYVIPLAVAALVVPFFVWRSIHRFLNYRGAD